MNLRLIPLLFLALACSDADDATAQDSGTKTDTPKKAASGDGSGVDRAAVQASIDKGAKWLRAQAGDNGIFTFEMKGQKMPSPAHTALALAPIALELPAGKRAADPLVAGASGFLLKCQRADGAIDPGPQTKYENYYTSAGLMALSIVADPKTADAREKMKKFILSLQRLDDDRIKGGFGYNTQKSADLSNAQYAVEALRTAGVPDSDPAMQRLLVFLERTQNRSENTSNKDAKYTIDGKKIVPGNDGSAGYEPGVSKAGMHRLPDGTYVPRGYGSMTYALLKCYILVGLKADDQRVKATLAWLGDNYSWDENPGFRDIAKETNRPEAPYWGLFYYYVTAAKALRLVGADTIKTPEGERDWRADLAAAILKRQAADGSWMNEKSSRWEEKDKIISTSYALIALQEILGKE
ncbi:MAG: prenyltransferase/squalene oxidase repeat-containing protein [Planctomycetota bacterium]|jgi:squalene-hopene/tetraprenyl-beta-curcumene cyclase